MIRDKNGRFVKDSEKAEVRNDREDCVCYRSKILNKYFDTYEQLRSEEDEYLKKQEEKKIESDRRKKEASEVETAFKTLNSVKKEQGEIMRQSEKDFAAAIEDARKKYQNTVRESKAKIEDAENVYQEALEAFQKKHPEGYHLTLRDGESSVTLSRNNYIDIMDDFCTSIFKMFDFSF